MDRARKWHRGVLHDETEVRACQTRQIPERRRASGQGCEREWKEGPEWEAMRWNPIGEEKSRSWFHAAVTATFVDVSEGDGGGFEEKLKEEEERGETAS